jgi:lysozyme family protein
MTSFTFAALSPEYTKLLSLMRVTRTAEVNATADRLLGYIKEYYATASAKTGVPAIWLATVGEREGGTSIFRSYFGNGDPLSRPTIDVPRGRGPFATFEEGLLDSLHYDRIDSGNPNPWTWAWALFRGEGWNGFGPRMHGKHTGYLWAGTNIYTGGKYVRDNVWDASAFDSQLGIVPVMARLVELDPTLQLADWPEPATIPPPMLPPIGLHDAKTLQEDLNKLGASLNVDGSYGRQTMAAVRAFQEQAGIGVDGLAGSETWAAIEAKLAGAVSPTT